MFTLLYSNSKHIGRCHLVDAKKEFLRWGDVGEREGRRREATCDTYKSVRYEKKEKFPSHHLFKLPINFFVVVVVYSWLDFMFFFMHKSDTRYLSNGKVSFFRVFTVIFSSHSNQPQKSFLFSIEFESTWSEEKKRKIKLPSEINIASHLGVLFFCCCCRTKKNWTLSKRKGGKTGENCMNACDNTQMFSSSECQLFQLIENIWICFIDSWGISDSELLCSMWASAWYFVVCSHFRSSESFVVRRMKKTKTLAEWNGRKATAAEKNGTWCEWKSQFSSLKSKKSSSSSLGKFSTHIPSFIYLPAHQQVLCVNFFRWKFLHSFLFSRVDGSII